MSRMMPARVRSEGIALYSKGFLNDPIETDFKLTAEIDGEEVSYDLDGAQDSCTCSIFQQNHRYCKHIAAIEEYLKNQDKGSLETKDKETKGAERGLYNENIAFLDAVNGETQLNFSTDQYSIEVQIEDNSQLYDYFSMDYFLYFDLKLKSKNLGRSYVIKDIPYFLRALKNYSQYSLGSLHYIDLFFDNFDESSQEFLSFLLKIDGKSDEALTKSLFIKNGRYLNIPFLFLEEAMDLVSALEVYQLKIIGRTVNYFTFIPLDNDSEIFKFKVESQQDYIELSLFSEDYHNFYDYSLLYDNNVFYKLNQEQRRLLLVLDKQFAQKSKIKFSYSEKDKLAQALQQLSTLGKIEAPEHFVVKPFDAKFTFDLLDEKMLSLAMKFDYGTFSIDSFHDLETLEFSRDLRKEQKIFALMERLQFAKAFNSTLEITEHLSENFFLKILPSFQKLGQIELSPTLRNMRMDEVPEIHIDSQGGLLDISFDIPHVEDGEFANVIAKLQENAEFYISESGKFYHFNEKFDRLKAALHELDDQFVIQGSSLHVNINRSFQISKIFEKISGASFSEKFKSLYQHLTHPEEFPYEKPEHIKASLRSYQETGVRWMSMLSHYNLGGILADDMGLGKTVQAITFILSNLKKDESVLITAPASLTYNWASEFEKFTDEIDFVVIDGNKADRTKEIQENHQIYITSYGSFLKDFEDYQDKKLNYLLLDEAQVVKNYSSKTNKSLSALNVEHTFALSGTPLENRIEEIWAIFQVVMPGFLPKREKFNKMEPSVISRLIQPFIMRRKKGDVLEELPDKMEITVYNQLADDQKVIYLAQLELMQKQVLEMDNAALSRSRIEILAGITRLRQICNTPALFMDDYKGSSGKLERLRELLAQIKDSGHRPLIFSQFTKVFPHIEKLMEEQEMTAYKLTGSTPIKDRLSMVQAFNAGSRDAFLVSLKAGGVGLNLTSADVVILVDLWWNPAVEEQAIARAHRMGQKNTVEVIRLITQGTIEEKIMEIQERKKDLIANVLEGDTVDKVLSEAEIREILGV
ncbi:DEAD/DEAH box helicase [Lactococcus cremoris]|uniref:SWI/SNF family helicase n=1 Tax=Lactococcus lactis subsp. cremoris (strain MG1363) TaxID=416870 RepID=A2RNJ2_LACLM|nr:SNF2 helicase associated domain-containing protein [Lactococcus cremoris]MCT4435446.1 helicase [Lactococcus cremoris]MCT4446081.1 helicase [Lactococcus cremoris]MCZ7688198.1 SNF2 helicase associated domain-containing protein [Lactococcus cremoris]MCZ7690731.1 SNF2 helicase associated domain-containing protein [Lactococcus cremoris]MRM08081.1 helicase [Lactococcus cremoris subsp. cremoris MG1363]